MVGPSILFMMPMNVFFLVAVVVITTKHTPSNSCHTRGRSVLVGEMHGGRINAALCLRCRCVFESAGSILNRCNTDLFKQVVS